MAETHAVGLLGGTFDPPHLGHLVIAEHLRVMLGLDEVRLVVAGSPWMKGEVTPARVRLELVQAAVAGLEGIGVDAREVERVGPTYTADTLAELAAEVPGARLVFALGTDAARRLDEWERVEEVFARAEVVVVNRPGSSPDLPRDLDDRVTRLDVPLLSISSTELRARYRNGGPTRFLVPDAVERLIRSRGLYGAGATAGPSA